MAKCNVIDRMMAYTNIIFFHKGKVKSDALDDNAFMAFSISITTRIDKEMVDADFETSLVNMSQPISGNSEEHLWKCD